jgi:hypothetical protein
MRSMADQPDNLVLESLRQLRADIAETNVRIDMLRDEFKGDINSLRADVSSDLFSMQSRNEAEHKATREQVAGLRRAAVEYHSAVVGHGGMISDLDARVRRLEQKAGFSDA